MLKHISLEGWVILIAVAAVLITYIPFVHIPW